MGVCPFLPISDSVVDVPWGSSMVNDPSSSPLIDWTPDGLGFIITDAQALAAQQLPKVYKHNNVRHFPPATQH